MPVGSREKQDEAVYSQKERGLRRPYSHHGSARGAVSSTVDRLLAAAKQYRTTDPSIPICSGHRFLRLRLHVSTLHLGVLDAAKIHVCSVVNTGAADCLLVTILPCRPGWFRKKNYQRVSSFSYCPEAELGEQMEPQNAPKWHKFTNAR